MRTFTFAVRKTPASASHTSKYTIFLHMHAKPSFAHTEKSMGAAAILPLTKRNNTEKKTLIASAAYDISNSYTLQPVILIR